MNRNKELAKNTAIITIGKMSTQFLNFFLLPLYTTILSTEEYGLVDLFVTYTSLLMPIVLFQVDQAVFRFLIDERQNEQGQRRVLSTSICFAALQSLVVIVLFCLLQPFISIQHKWFLLLNILASVTSNMMSQVARGMGDNVTFALGSFASATTQIILNIVLLVVIKMGVTGMLVATVLGHLGCTFVVLIRDKVYKYVSFKEFDRNTLVNILKYAFPLIPNALCWWVLNASDRTIVLFFLGTAANGLLSIGHKFSTVYITIYNIFNLSWTESASLHMNDKYRDVYYRFAYHSVSLEDNIQWRGKAVYGRKKFSIIILDKDMRMIGETLFPEYSYNSNLFFVNKDGLYLCKTHSKRSDFDENVFCFQCFELIKKND